LPLYLTEANVGSLLTPADALEAVEGCFRRLAAGEVENRPRERLRPSAFSVILSPGRAGATDIALLGAFSPARDNSQPASSVSASGTAAA